MTILELNKKKICKYDINKFVLNVNKNIDTYNEQLTIRNRSIDFKGIMYYLTKYNLNTNSSYDTTNINIFSNGENNDVSSQAYINKRKKISLEHLNNINNDLISSFYKHLNLKEENRYIAVDGSQLNFLHSLKNEFSSSKNENYTFAYLSCLFDVNAKMPINYLISNNDERTMLINQLSCLKKKDTLIADRGYYSNNLVTLIQKNNLNFVFRISRHNKFYIDNATLINTTKEGSIEINNGDSKYKLHWYATRIKTENIKKEIEKIDDKYNIIQTKLKTFNDELLKNKNDYDNLSHKNKVLISNLKKINSSSQKDNDDLIAKNKLENKDEINDNLKTNRDAKNKLKNKDKMNDDLKTNRNAKNKLKVKIDEIKKIIEELKAENKELIEDKKKLQLDNASNYMILTNDLTKSLNEIKHIYEKRWEVETHFKFIKQETKINQMENKNVNYIKQNILITHFIFIIESYINNYLEHYIKNDKRINKASLIESLRNKLLYLIFYHNEKNEKLIMKIMNKLLKILIKIIKIIEYKPRIKKRPQKNHYCINIKK